MMHDLWRGSVASLALGSLSVPETEAVRAHLAECDKCRTEFDELRPVADMVGYAAEATQLDPAISARMKSRLLRAIQTAESPATASASPEVSIAPNGLTTMVPAQRSRRRWFATSVGYLAAAAALAFAFNTWRADSTFRSDNAANLERIAVLQHDITARDKEIDEARSELTDLFARDSQHFAVKGGEVIRRKDRLYLALRELPPLPVGKVFQVWTIAPGKSTPAPSITFIPGANGAALIAIPVAAAQVGAVAVSIEPPGGSRAPTTTPIFIRPTS